MDADLHITIRGAGDPEKLGELLKAAIATQKKELKVIVPTGYRCYECFAGDGGHEAGCSMIVATHIHKAEGPAGE